MSESHPLDFTEWRGQTVTYRDALQLRASERMASPGVLVDIHFVQRAALTALPIRALLDQHCYRAWSIYAWESTDGPGTSDPSMPVDEASDLDGAFTIFASPSGATPRPIVFVKIPDDESPLGYAIQLASLEHELGHVEDFERGICFRLGKPRSVYASERYAHAHAIRQLQTHRHVLAAFAYMASIRPKPTADTSLPYVRAMIDALGSREAIDAAAWIDSIYPGFGTRARTGA